MTLWAGSTLCSSFKRELFEGLHDFRLDTFRLALYGPDAALDANVAAYTEEGEILPLGGYLRGGQIVETDPPLLVGSTAIVPFNSAVWTPGDFKARGGLCYNASKPGMPALFVLDFGAMREGNGRNFIVQFRGPDPMAAIVRLL